MRGDVTLLMTFREAADVSFQIVLAVGAVAFGMSLASLAAKSEQPRQMVDVSRPVLWEASVVRVDRHEPLTLTVNTAANQPEGDLCSDAIGLRISCNLLKTTHRPS
jgi:hypothetical protein